MSRGTPIEILTAAADAQHTAVLTWQECNQILLHFDYLAEKVAAAEAPVQPVLGTVQKARWNEWEAVCSVPRCGWHHSQGNKTREDAESHMRGHAAIVHPPRIPVRAEGI